MKAAVRAAALLAAVAAACSAAAAGGGATGGGSDWPMFGYTPARTNSAPGSAAITAANVGHLRRQQVAIPGTVDASPIYLHGVNAGGRTRNVLFVTTTYGITLAIDAASGKIVWRYTPPSYASLAGSPQITNMTPVADPSAHRDLRRGSGRVHPQALDRQREGALGDLDHARPHAREAAPPP